MITNVGQLLKKERENKDITLEQVEKETRIRLINLKAIESEDWSQFQSRTYVQGVIKRYGSFLGLDAEKLSAYFRRDYEKLENLKFKKKAEHSQFTPNNKRFLQLLISVVVLLFGFFFSYQIYLFSVPPKVTILEPTKTTFRRENKFTLKGTAKKETVIMVNGRQAFLDEKNIFQIDIPLTEKENKVTIVATGANGKKTTLEKTYIRTAQD
ncbi:helix-turn-helix domain-containing protein [Candidatus Woesebacteria bacterium]|nr:helix-turn-helix domain-containing protein [Candidatus Woesebacteria bacterium]